MPEEVVKAEGTGGTEEKSPANAAEVVAAVKEPIKHTIIVDGKERELTLEELKEKAQKEISADTKFRAADSLTKSQEEDKKTAEHHRGMMEVVLAAKTPGPKQAEALRAMARDYPAFGITEADAETVIASIAENEKKDKGDIVSNKDTPAGPPTFEEMPDRVQKSVIDAESRTRETNLTTVRETLAAALDKDEVLHTIFIGKRKENRIERMTTYALTALSQKVTKAGRYTPDAVRAAVEETRQFATDIGLLDVDDSAPGTPLGLSRGPTASFGQVRTPGTPPSQISPKDALDTEKYSNNVFDRLQYAAMQDKE